MDHVKSSHKVLPILQPSMTIVLTNYVIEWPPHRGFIVFQTPKRMVTYSHFFCWMDRVKETLYETKDYRGEPPPPTEAMFVNLVHCRAMPLQIRQIRVKSGELFLMGTTD